MNASLRGSWARHGWYLLAGALGVVLLGGALRRRAAPEAAAQAAQTPAALVSSTFEPPPTLGESSSVAVSPRSGSEPALPSRHPPAVSPAPSAPLAGEHPHPITPAHQRIFEENKRIAELNGALDRGDFAALRALNAEYRSAYPEDEHVLQQGYDLIADCLQQHTAQVVDEARRFWREKRSSSLRRYVRKLCLDGLPP